MCLYGSMREKKVLWTFFRRLSCIWRRLPVAGSEGREVRIRLLLKTEEGVYY